MKTDRHTIIEIIDQENKIVKLLFWPVMTSPVWLTTLLYQLASGSVESENHVILFGLLLVVYRVIFGILYFANFQFINKIIMRNSEKKPKGTIENYLIKNDFNLEIAGKELDVSVVDRQIIVKTAFNISKMRLVIVWGTLFDILTFLLIGFLL